MAYGAEVKNSSGDVVFNTLDPVFEIVGKGTITLNLQFINNVSDTLWVPPFSSYSTIRNFGYQKQDALGDWDDGVIHIFEVPVGGRVYLHQTTADNGTRNYMTVVAHNPVRTPTDTMTVRYVTARIATYFAPSTGYGMEFYDASGQVTWSSNKPVLSNVLPLSVQSSTNTWFSWNGDFAMSQGSSCGLSLYRGINKTSGGFTKYGTQFRGWPGLTRNTKFCGMSAVQDINGFSCDINWNTI